MKVIELGRGLRGIFPEPDRLWSDSIRSFNRRRLKRMGLSNEEIETHMYYFKLTFGYDPDESEDR
ncbi:MAG: hypothetical protein FWD68_14795 [Alphaproteobacteria bacterium]|nr:hypothetical protein [Alphaproteobacteria bacterium]